jgi:hypothetical protein
VSAPNNRELWITLPRSRFTPDQVEKVALGLSVMLQEPISVYERRGSSRKRLYKAVRGALTATDLTEGR